jgi:hypothetical protein
MHMRLLVGLGTCYFNVLPCNNTRQRAMDVQPVAHRRSLMQGATLVDAAADLLPPAAAADAVCCSVNFNQFLYCCAHCI